MKRASELASNEHQKSRLFEEIKAFFDATYADCASFDAASSEHHDEFALFCHDLFKGAKDREERVFYDEDELVDRVLGKHSFSAHLGKKRARNMAHLVFSLMQDSPCLIPVLELAVFCGFIVERGNDRIWFKLKRTTPVGTRTVLCLLDLIRPIIFDFDVTTQQFPRRYVVFEIWRRDFTENKLLELKAR